MHQLTEQDLLTPTPKLLTRPPTSHLEKKIAAIIAKKPYKEKLKENQILAQFDAKMQRIKKIKSKTYRKIRRKMASKLKDKVDDFEIDCKNYDDVDNDNLANEALITKSDLEVKNEDKQEEAEELPPIIAKLKAKAMAERVKTKPATVFNFKNNKSQDKKQMFKSLFAMPTEQTKLFQSEKQATIANDEPKVEKTVLPGWNTWGGAEIELVENKYNTIVKVHDGIQQGERKDCLNADCIINENLNGFSEKYKMKVPYGWTKAEFEKKMRVPVSRDGNSLRVFNRLVKSKVRGEELVYRSKYRQ